MVKAQMKIQQMAFMIVAILFFFILVGIFFIGWQYKSTLSNFEQQEQQKAISSIKVISDMPELNCDSRRSFCLDEDKIKVMSRKSSEYSEFFPVASIKVYKILERENWTVYDSGQRNSREFSTYVSICKKISGYGTNGERCDMGKLVIGVNIKDEE